MASWHAFERVYEFGPGPVADARGVGLSADMLADFAAIRDELTRAHVARENESLIEERDRYRRARDVPPQHARYPWRR